MNRLELITILAFAVSAAGPATSRAQSTAPDAPAKETAAMNQDASTSPEHAALVEQVRRTEIAFAATMAARDHAAFATFLARDAVFFGARGPLRGAEVVAAAWRRYFDGAQAPFSWRPETVVVLDDGTLALTSGPVFEPDGKLSGTFTTIWRLEPDGHWRVVFDKGGPVCGDEAP